MQRVPSNGYASDMAGDYTVDPSCIGKAGVNKADSPLIGSLFTQKEGPERGALSMFGEIAEPAWIGKRVNPPCLGTHAGGSPPLLV